MNARRCILFCTLLALQLQLPGAGTDTNETLNPDQVEQINTNIRGSIGGIGLQMQKPDRELRIKEVMIDTPASKAGLKVGQIMTAINGIPAAAMKLEDAVKLCRGPVGTKVVLDVRDPGSSSRRVELVRETIVITGVSGRLVDTTVGLLAITTFNQQTPRKVKAVLEVFRGLDLGGLILDLRENGGGSYSASCQVASYCVGDAAPL